jgi:hypothetical protein
MTSPTKTAEAGFAFAKNHLHAIDAKGTDLHPALKTALMNMCWGMENMAIGLRATYMKLEEVERELQRLKRS